jgi:hypothetical protein
MKVSHTPQQGQGDSDVRLNYIVQYYNNLVGCSYLLRLKDDRDIKNIGCPCNGHINPTWGNDHLPYGIQRERVLRITSSLPEGGTM